ncbi:MAG: hypothetical protein KDE19_11850, partial [Caldilineaceae bacterium]|nr:hypothetical protein [Caldilineaceae bacterium]
MKSYSSALMSPNIEATEIEPAQMEEAASRRQEAATAADPSSHHTAPSTAPSQQVSEEEAFDLLRTLLFDEYRQQITQMRTQVVELQAVLDALEQQIQDEEALINTITPVIAGAIRTNISESRDEMVDALYPIMG